MGLSRMKLILYAVIDVHSTPALDMIRLVKQTG
jgi:hypothetical protein